MKELWVKKTIWRRYLVVDKDIEAAELTLKFDTNGDEIVGDNFDINGEVEYDNEKVVLPIKFIIQDIK